MHMRQIIKPMWRSQCLDSIKSYLTSRDVKCSDLRLVGLQTLFMSSEHCTILLVFPCEHTIRGKKQLPPSCVIMCSADHSKSCFSYYCEKGFSCARNYVRSLMNIKADIHHSVCNCVCLYDKPDPIIPQEGIACIVSPTLIRNVSSINWVHVYKCAEWHQLDGRHTWNELLGPSLKSSSGEAQLTY